jgi:hypothetical protein
MKLSFHAARYVGHGGSYHDVNVKEDDERGLRIRASALKPVMKAPEAPTQVDSG